MFGFKKKSDTPPDVGQEEVFDKKEGLSDEFSGGDDSAGKGLKKLDAGAAPAAGSASVAKGAPAAPTANSFHLERVEARVESVVEWIKQFYERFSYVSESIGEIRTMNLANEKKILEVTKDAEKVIDVVKEVKPDELRLDYQKSEMKVAALGEKIEANKLFMEQLMEEMNDLRRKSEVFIGTEGIMKLNEDTKKDLVELQKLGAKTRMQADKAEEIFMELRRGFAESQKVAAVVNNLDESYSGVRDSIEKLKLDYSKVVGHKDYLEFKKTYGSKLAVFDNNVISVEEMKRTLASMSELLETSLSIARRNEEDVGRMGMKLGDDDVKLVSDYENQMNDVVEIVGTLTEQIAELRKKAGFKVKRVVLKKPVVKVVAKPIVKKPSEDDGVVSAVDKVKVADVPKLRPDEFLGKENIVNKSVDAKRKAVVKEKIVSKEKLVAEKPIAEEEVAKEEPAAKEEPIVEEEVAEEKPVVEEELATKEEPIAEEEVAEEKPVKKKSVGKKRKKSTKK